MTLHIVVVTRNRSLYVKTLHTLLAIQGWCRHGNLQIELEFVNDANKEKMMVLKKKLKTGERVFWIDYGVSCDRDTIHHAIIKYDNFDCLVFPVAKEGVDWEMFRKKVLEGSTEPVHQMGLAFDTEINTTTVNKDPHFMGVRATNPTMWAMDTKTVTRKLKDKNNLVLPPTINEFFSKCLTRKVKIAASVSSQTFNHFTHECIGNIMNMAGLKVTKPV
jgi:hypothetical protein